jgi:hypothetical protein
LETPTAADKRKFGGTLSRQNVRSAIDGGAKLLVLASRHKTVGLAFWMVMVFFAARLIQLQVVQHDRLAAVATAQAAWGILYENHYNEGAYVQTGETIPTDTVYERRQPPVEKRDATTRDALVGQVREQPGGFVDSLYRSIGMGNVVFEAPGAMYEGEDVTATLILGPNKSAVGQTQLADSTGFVRAGIRIFSQMKAHLAGSGFNVKPITSEQQLVPTEGITKWMWSVTPIKHGALHLQLVISALVPFGGTYGPLTIRSFDKDIEVHASMSGYLSRVFGEKAWKNLVGPLLSALMVAPFRWFWRKKGKAVAARWAHATRLGLRRSAKWLADQL